MTAASEKQAHTQTPAAGRWPMGSRGAIIHALVLMLLLPVGGVVVGMLLRPYLPPVESPYDGSAAAFIRVAVQAVVGVGLFCGIGLLAIGRLRWRDLGWFDFSREQVVRGCVGFLAMFAAFTILMVTATEYTFATFFEAIASATWNQRLLGLCIGIKAAIMEESLYRGYLQSSLCKRLGTPGGIVLTAVLFSLMHVPSFFIAFLGRFVLGLAMGILRGKDQPLWAPAIAHILVWVVIGGSV